MRNRNAIRALAGLAVAALAFTCSTIPASGAAAPKTVGHQSLNLDFGDFTAKAELDYPTWRKNAPVVVLIPGSSPEDLNADIPAGPDGKQLSHIFLDLANSLTARGFAVMRYNKHYVTSMTQVDYQSYYTKLTLQGMLKDAGTVLTAAQNNPHVDRHRVFLYGWSEGSTVAAALAAAHPELTGIAFQGPVTQSWPSLFQWQYEMVGVPYLRQFAVNGGVGSDELKKASAGSGGLVAKEIIQLLAPQSYTGGFQHRPGTGSQPRRPDRHRQRAAACHSGPDREARHRPPAHLRARRGAARCQPGRAETADADPGAAGRQRRERTGFGRGDPEPEPAPRPRGQDLSRSWAHPRPDGDPDRRQLPADDRPQPQADLALWLLLHS
ncbi:alpha/beta hydrolase family protein [Fodinicola feengrottensis]|uniref:alpha/beta hydrolase family protein n=1 Tax=Fodinicola feengrottensis TaxID=435914 RepID=UPI0013D0B762|nr:acetylxylan esterase [Fodinicola feengrottensis]